MMTQLADLKPNTLLLNPHNGTILSFWHRSWSHVDNSLGEPFEEGAKAVTALVQNGDYYVTTGAPPTVATCKHCGCTEEYACEQGCSWTVPGECSSCSRSR